jgi:hypothetical protein
MDMHVSPAARSDCVMDAALLPAWHGKHLSEWKSRNAIRSVHTT